VNTVAIRHMSRGKRWAYTGTIIGGGISIAANVAHSFVAPPGGPDGWAPMPGAVIGSMFWPILLFVAIEILVRVVWPAGKWWTVLRFGGMIPVIGVAGLVSYRHLSGLLLHYGEDAIVAYSGPFAIDGLMVMATAALLVISLRESAAAEAGQEREIVPAEQPKPVEVSWPQLMGRARESVSTARQYGIPLPADRLAVQLGITLEQAGELLAYFDAEQPKPATPVQPAPAKAPTPAPAGSPSPQPAAPAVPASGLVQSARMVAVNHYNRHGRAITPEQLAAIMNLTLDAATDILDTIAASETESDPADAVDGRELAVIGGTR
jgi:hypothetical protein